MVTSHCISLLFILYKNRNVRLDNKSETCGQCFRLSTLSCDRLKNCTIFSQLNASLSPYGTSALIKSSSSGTSCVTSSRLPKSTNPPPPARVMPSNQMASPSLFPLPASSLHPGCADHTLFFCRSTLWKKIAPFWFTYSS